MNVPPDTQDDGYDEDCLALGHEERTTYEDDEIWQGVCDRCGAELWDDKEPSA